jgi:hypothetical protein
MSPPAATGSSSTDAWPKRPERASKAGCQRQEIGSRSSHLARPSCGSRMISRQKQVRIVLQRAASDLDSDRQSLRFPVSLDGARDDTEQISSFLQGDVHLFHPVGEISTAHAALLISQNIEGIGGVIDPVLPLYSTAVSNHSRGTEDAVIFQRRKEVLAADDACHIDAVDTAVSPPDNKRVRMLGRNVRYPSHIFVIAASTQIRSGL